MLDRNSEQSVDLHQVLWIACQLGGEDCETDVQPLACQSGKSRKMAMALVTQTETRGDGQG